uniref:Agglutinin WBA1 n=1 Tax=Psophocarpus tetragonolobus TaxID=3891 RepID=Q7M1M1_PSOTE
KTISFNFNQFHQNEEQLKLQRDARISSNGVLQLTKVVNGVPKWQSTGRALYAKPVQIWDSTTGNVASFETRFSFSIPQPFPRPTPADGLVFFIAPLNTITGPGGGYHLIYNKLGEDNIFVVEGNEFDTFRNTWDPQIPHIGIDVNSVISTKTVPFTLDNGQIANVVIKYDASTKILHVVLVFPSSGTIYTIAQLVNVQESVNVGFSAATGDPSGKQRNATETHDILSWSFSASLPGTN